MKKLLLGLMLLAGAVSFANNSPTKKAKLLTKTASEERARCTGYTSDGDRVDYSCASCNTIAECQAKLKKLLE